LHPDIIRDRSQIAIMAFHHSSYETMLMIGVSQTNARPYREEMIQFEDKIWTDQPTTVRLYCHLTDFTFVIP
jgi:hypothetical protein